MMIATAIFCLNCISAANLTVQIEGLPPGVDAQVEVSYPGGTKTLTATETLPDVGAGSVTATSSAVRAPGQFVDTVYIAQPVKTEVKGAETALVVKYTPRGGTGMLWIGSDFASEDNAEIAQMRAVRDASLAAGFTSFDRVMSAPVRMDGPYYGTLGSFIANDHWEGRFAEFQPGYLSGAGSVSFKPQPEERGGVIHRDPNGTLWLGGEGFFWRLDSSFKPNLKLEYEDGGDEVRPSFFNAAFDHEGNLIAVGNSHAWYLKAAQLKAPGSPKPVVTKFPSGGVNHVALDKENAAYVVNEIGQIQVLTRDQYTKGGETEASRELSVPQSANCLAFDNEGGMWVSVRYSAQLLYFPPGESSFVEKGSVGPSMDEGSKILFNPPPAWSSLNVKGKV